MHFCPTCANMLHLKMLEGSQHFACPTCSYRYRLMARVASGVILEHKDEDEVVDEQTWENVDQTEASCPQCHYHRAYYMQRQIRSGDEAMTLFFKCVKCAHRWCEDN